MGRLGVGIGVYLYHLLLKPFFLRVGSMGERERERGIERERERERGRGIGTEMVT